MEGVRGKPRDVNVLLLGESGAGKSTFINSLANYLAYDSLEDALHFDIKWRVPAHFTITDENYDEISISIGNPSMENYSGHTVTQGVTDYDFDIEDVKMHLIDTPPLGVNDDDKNMKQILSYISNCNHINAIAFFLKPSVSILNQYFKHCLNSLLSRLNKSVFKNIVFVFTHTRSTFYKPGETLTILTQVLNEMSSEAKAAVPCSRENMFCLDNETFRYLVAYKSGVMSDDKNMKVFSQSWKHSTECYKNFIKYLVGGAECIGLEPFMIRTATSSETIRKTVVALFRILADISLILHENMNILYSEELCRTKNDIPFLVLEKVPQNKMFGCSHCIEKSKILHNGNATFSIYQCLETELNYNNNKSYSLTSLSTLSMKKSVCKKCSHNLTHHKEILYVQKLHKMSISEDKERQMEIGKLISIFERELEILIGFLAECQIFRKYGYSDLFKDFLQSQINWNRDRKREYDALKKRYGDLRTLLSKQQILAIDIENKLKTVYDLEYTGQMLRKIYPEFLPQNEVFKKQPLELPNVKSPNIQQKKLTIHFRPTEDDKTKQDLEPQIEQENFKKRKSDLISDSKIEQTKSQNSSKADFVNNTVAKNVKLYEDKHSDVKPNDATYDKYNKSNYGAEKAKFGHSTTSEDISQRYTILADKDKSQHQAHDDVLTNKTKNTASHQDKSEAIRSKCEAGAERAAFFCNFISPIETFKYSNYQADKFRSQHEVHDDIPTNTIKNPAANQVNSEANVKVEDIICDNKERNHNRDEMIRICKNYGFTRETSTYQEAQQDNIRNPNDERGSNYFPQQDKSFASQPMKNPNIVPDNLKNLNKNREEDEERGEIYNSRINYYEAQNLHAQSQNWDDEFLNYASSEDGKEKNLHKTHPAQKLEHNYFPKQDISNGSSITLKMQSAFNNDMRCNNEEPLNKFQLKSNVEEPKQSNMSILNMYQEFVSFANGQKQLFEQLSNKVDLLETSMNEIKDSIKSITQYNDEKLDKFSQVEAQVQRNMCNLHTLHNQILENDNKFHNYVVAQYNRHDT